MKEPKIGDYVLATKYRDGDPGDHFVVGFYSGSFSNGHETRHDIVDADGKKFRGNGFRRVAMIGADRGAWIVKNAALIESFRNRFSVWHWHRAPWAQLRGIEKAFQNRRVVLSFPGDPDLALP
jgi:hypothetical protein